MKYVDSTLQNKIWFHCHPEAKPKNLSCTIIRDVLLVSGLTPTQHEFLRIQLPLSLILQMTKTYVRRLVNCFDELQNPSVMDNQNRTVDAKRWVASPNVWPLNRLFNVYSQCKLPSAKDAPTEKVAVASIRLKPPRSAAAPLKPRDHDSCNSHPTAKSSPRCPKTRHISAPTAIQFNGS